MHVFIMEISILPCVQYDHGNAMFTCSITRYLELLIDVATNQLKAK